MFAVNSPVSGFDTSRDAFCGACRGFGEPETVLSACSTNSIAHGWAPVGSHHLTVELDPKESHSFIFLLGFLESVRENVSWILPAPSYQRNLGEISSYPPGYKENAGIFCHNNPWISIAETILGHGNRAFEIYKKTCPVYLEGISEIYRTEPYVYCQMVAGKDAPTFGEGKNSWLTGTAAWTFTNVSQHILGIRPTLDGLCIEPCIPDTLDGFDCDRYYRGAVYHIHVDNSAHVQKGVVSMTIDGQPAAGNVIPIQKDKTEYQFYVTLGA